MLQEAAIGFLQYADKDKGNQLEKEVYQKQQSPECMSNLKADVLMFHHVYADFVMLVKSEELHTSAYDMSKHYQELSLFLAAVEKDPRIMMDKSTRVFPSERRLYEEEVKLNHCLHSKFQLRRMSL